MTGSTTALASVADKVHTILEAAEATAAAIRHEAEADAERAARERRRRDDARDELSHLSRLADALSVQAEAVSRQCDIVARVLLAPEDDAGAAVEPAERRSQPVEGTPAAGPDPAAGPEAARPAAAPPGTDTPSAQASASDSRAARDGGPANGERLPSPWIAAYRMRLAGAGPGEVEAHLRRTGADDPSKVVDEVFRDEEEPPSRPQS